MSGYKHGAYVQEVNANVAAPRRNETGLHVIFGTAPINMSEAPDSAVNKLIMVNTYEEGVKKLGYSEDFANYTLCQAMDAYFKIFAVGPVVFCNVLNPNKHKTSNAEKVYTVINKQVVLDEDGVLPGTLEAKTEEGTALTRERDYITSFDDAGKLVITILDAGNGETVNSLKVTSESINPKAVTEADIIGGVDASTGKETGLELVRRVYPRCGKFPGYIMAPGWSKNRNVAAVMAAKCGEINGVFTCECLVDLDTNIVKRHTDCEKEKEDSGLNSPHMIVLWPKAYKNGKIYDYSAIYGAMTAQTDADNDSVPTVSPSNQLLNIDGAVLEDGTEIELDQPEANMLNGQGIVTILNNEGMRSWGNNTAAYPGITEPKDRWINCRRAFSWWANTFIITCREKVDSPANYRLIESIVDAENIRGNSYVQQGKFAGAKMEYIKSENSVDNLLEGHIKVRQYLAPYTPAEYILNVLSFDPSLLENALGGNA